MIKATPGIIAASGKQGGVKKYYKVPSLLFPEFTAQIWNEGGSDVFTDYNFNTIPDSVTGTTGYVDLDSAVNGTGTIGSPFNTMASCNASSYNIFYVKGRGRQANSSATWTKNVKVLSWSLLDNLIPPPELTTQTNTNLVWVQNGTQPTVYDATWPSASGFINTVMDRAVIDSNGCYTGYTAFTSLANVAAGPGRFWYDSANNTLRVRTIDGRVPDSNIIGLLGSGTFFSHTASISSNRYIYAEGLITAGGSTSANMGTTGAGTLFIGFKDCTFLCAGGTEASTYMTGRTQGYFRNCKSFYHRDDAFDYNSTLSSLFLEWYCKSGNNSWSGSSINGTTSHENSRVIRVKGDYQNTAGKCLQDINNSKSYNIRLNAGGARAASPDDFPYATNSVASGLTEMYLIECITTQSNGKGYRNFSNSTLSVYDGSVGNLLTATNTNTGTPVVVLSEEDVFVNKLLLKLNLGMNGTAPTVPGWKSIWGESNPDNAAGTIDSSRSDTGTNVWSQWGNIGGSGISLRSINTGNDTTSWARAAINSGQSTGNNSGIYPDLVLTSFWYVNGGQGKIEIYGLNNSKTYKITLMASRDSAVGGSRRSIFTVNGVALTALQSIGNTTNTVSRTGVSPISGVITVLLDKDDNSLAYINSIIIEEE